MNACLLLWALWGCGSEPAEPTPAPDAERLPTAAELKARPPEAPTPQDLARTWAAGEHDDWEGTKKALATFGDSSLERAIRSNCLRRRLAEQIQENGAVAAAEDSVALSTELGAKVVWGPIVDGLRDCGDGCRAEAAAFVEAQRGAHPDAWSLAAASFDLTDDPTVKKAALEQLQCLVGDPPAREVELAFQNRLEQLGDVTLAGCGG